MPDRQRRIPLDPPRPPGPRTPSLQPGRCPRCGLCTWRRGSEPPDLEPWLADDQVVRMRHHRCPTEEPR